MSGDAGGVLGGNFPPGEPTCIITPDNQSHSRQVAEAFLEFLRQIQGDYSVHSLVHGLCNTTLHIKKQDFRDHVLL